MLEEEKICRYCFESALDSDDPQGNNLLSPCGCSGTQRYVHQGCLYLWQQSILLSSSSLSSLSFSQQETRHIRCSTCGETFRGVRVPNRLELIEARCPYQNYPSALQNGCYLVTSQTKSERNLLSATSSNIPPVLRALFELKSSHWKYGVYMIFHFDRIPHEISVGEEPILALNLTRCQNGTRDEPIPDEVLREIDHNMVVLSSQLHEDPRPGVINIRHFNGGPVNWSSVRIASCVMSMSREYLSALFQQSLSAVASQESDETIAGETTPPPPRPPPVSHAFYDVMNPAAAPHEQFKIWTITPEKSMVIGKFSDVLAFVRHIFQQTSSPAPHPNDSSSTPATVPTNGTGFLINSFSGYAKWSRAQLIQELSDPQGWGLVVPEQSLPISGEYLETGKYRPRTAVSLPLDDFGQDGEEEKRDERSEVASAGEGQQQQAEAEETRQLWRSVRELCLPREEPVSG
jgi:hypothetical protein